MSALASQRCLHHAAREAVARCPECGQFFCRECITEHEDRVICASCVKKLATPGAGGGRGARNVWPACQLAGGLLFAWALFYLCGLGLLSIPAEFHDEKVWTEKLSDLLQMQDFGDE